MQAGSIQALRYRDDPAGDIARLRAEGRAETTPKRFARRIEELVAGHSTLEVIAKALLSAHAALLRELDMFEKLVRAMARRDKRARLMMSAPGVGAIVALTYVSAIDDPSRFSSSKWVGPHFGLTPRKY